VQQRSVGLHLAGAPPLGMLRHMRIVLTTLHSKYIHPSLALPCLAAFCADIGHELPIREFTIHEPKENVLAALLAEQPDAIAFSVYLWNRRETFELLDLLHAAAPNLRLIVGGPEVIDDGAALFYRHPGLTALIRGEGEEPLHGLLSAWTRGESPYDTARLAWRQYDTVVEGPDGPPLADLDTLPSPFARQQIDTSRGFVYYETSRGCPYRCSFCMSARDDQVRSFSMARIENDLGLLLATGTPKIKLVDRTFNYDAERARRLFRFILERNRGSHLHFEIGAHLLDEPTLQLLETVPEETFQFEIGVQSTLPKTLQAISRRVAFDRLFDNVKALRERTRVHIHLDLITGLPGETVNDVLRSIDVLMPLTPHHLQIETLKVLPGSPLHAEAEQLGLRFDPHPPYTVVGTPDIDFAGLEELRHISRLLDLTWNSDRLHGFLHRCADEEGSWAQALSLLAEHLHEQGAFRHPLSQMALFTHCADAVTSRFADSRSAGLLEALAHDVALRERLTADSAPMWIETRLTTEEQRAMQTVIDAKTAAVRGLGIKLQHFAAVFRHLDPGAGRQVRLYFYLTRSNQGREVEVVTLPVA